MREAPPGGLHHYKPPVELRERCYSRHVRQEDARKNKEQNTKNAEPDQNNERAARPGVLRGGLHSRGQNSRPDRDIRADGVQGVRLRRSAREDGRTAPGDVTLLFN